MGLKIMRVFQLCQEEKRIWKFMKPGSLILQPEIRQCQKYSRLKRHYFELRNMIRNNLVFPKELKSSKDLPIFYEWFYCANWIISFFPNLCIFIIDKPIKSISFKQGIENSFSTPEESHCEWMYSQQRCGLYCHNLKSDDEKEIIFKLQSKLLTFL